MRVTVLGCSGGIGGSRHTTCLRLDNDVLVDAGTGAMEMDLDELVHIDRVFLTHTHLDHIAALPLMVDTVGSMRSSPVQVHASCAALANLQAHIFNWRIWPDFHRIPTVESPFMVYHEMEEGERCDLGGGRYIRALPVNHTVPAVAYHVGDADGSLVFSGDTFCCAEFWRAVNAIPDLQVLIVETAFSEREKDIAVASKHLCPSLLRDELALYTGDAPVYITHLKPREEDLIMEEVHRLVTGREVHRLRNGQIFQWSGS